MEELISFHNDSVLEMSSLRGSNLTESCYCVFLERMQVTSHCIGRRFAWFLAAMMLNKYL